MSDLISKLSFMIPRTVPNAHTSSQRQALTWRKKNKLSEGDVFQSQGSCMLRQLTLTYGGSCANKLVTQTEDEI